MKEKLLCNNLMNVLSDYWVYIFSPLAIIVAIVSCVFCYTTTFALVVSLIVFFILLYGLYIDYRNWDCKRINDLKGVFKYVAFYSITLAIFHLLSYIISYQEEGVDCYFYAYLVSTIVCGILIFIIIVSIDNINDNTPSVTLFCILVSLVIILPTSCAEENYKIEDAKFSKESFVPVQKWYKEMYNGYTVYIVVCEKGTFKIYPNNCPEIRDIHEGTKIKVLVEDDNQCGYLTDYSRIEIKN